MTNEECLELYLFTRLSYQMDPLKEDIESESRWREMLGELDYGLVEAAIIYHVRHDLVIPLLDNILETVVSMSNPLLTFEEVARINHPLFTTACEIMAGEPWERLEKMTSAVSMWEDQRPVTKKNSGPLKQVRHVSLTESPTSSMFNTGLAYLQEAALGYWIVPINVRNKLMDYLKEREKAALI